MGALIVIDAFTTSEEYKGNINVTLKRLQHSHLNKVISPCLSSNFIRNKVGDLNKMVDENIDILRIAETKLDELFPNNQFQYQYNPSICTG